MDIKRETIRAMIKDYDSLDLTEEELDIVEEGLKAYANAVAQMADLELGDVVSARVMQAKQGGKP